MQVSVYSARLKPWRRCKASSSTRVWRRDTIRSSSSRLPPISFSYDPSSVDTEELADLFQQVATYSPGQAFHAPGWSAPSNGEAQQVLAKAQLQDSSSSNTTTATAGSRGPDSVLIGSGYCGSLGKDCWEDLAARSVAATRLRRALRRSQVCVAAFASEKHLPEHQHLHSRWLAVGDGASDGSCGSNSSDGRAGEHGCMPPLMPGLNDIYLPTRPLAFLRYLMRAVTDAALVATVHDLAVMPELQGLGLGRQLMDRLTKQLYRLDIVDVGLLAPTTAECFFEGCSFGPDPEESITMMLSIEGKMRWGQPGQWEFIPRPTLRELLLSPQR